jgi:hypothetical protein
MVIKTPNNGETPFCLFGGGNAIFLCAHSAYNFLKTEICQDAPSGSWYLYVPLTFCVFPGYPEYSILTAVPVIMFLLFALTMCARTLQKRQLGMGRVHAGPGIMSNAIADGAAGRCPVWNIRKITYDIFRPLTSASRSFTCTESLFLGGLKVPVSGCSHSESGSDKICATKVAGREGT